MAQLPKWRTGRSSLRIDIFLSAGAMSSSYSPVGQLAGFELQTTVIDPDTPIPEESTRNAKALIVEVLPHHPESMARISDLLGQFPNCPVLAAVRDPSLSDIRTLMHMGVKDIVPLPLSNEELEPTLQRLRIDIERIFDKGTPKGKVVSITKCRGGIGATTILSQLASLTAMSAKNSGDVCLVDLDVQFGNAALYLGELPRIGVKDLLDAGGRADGELLRSTTTRHASGLHYLAAPAEIMPLETIESDQILYVLDLLATEFGTVFVDLPTSWTNWSLSTLARSDLILLVTELSVASLHQAKRQVDFMQQQGIAAAPVEVIVNRVQKRMFKTLGLDDAKRIIGRDVSFTIADDAKTVQSALDLGVMVTDVDARSRVAKDFRNIAESLSTRAVAEL